jgi:hypothetical protein
MLTIQGWFCAKMQSFISEVTSTTKGLGACMDQVVEGLPRKHEALEFKPQY